MNILVLGANGYIGKAFVRELLKDKAIQNIKLFDITLPNEDVLKNKKVSFFQGNILHEPSINEMFKNVDIVFHFLGKAMVRRGTDVLTDDLSNDLGATITILNAMVANYIKKIVFLSSGGAIYGSSNSSPIMEELNTCPISTYGLVKQSCETVISFYQRQFSIEPIILRVASVYGPNYNKIGIQGVIPTFIDQIKNKKPITVLGTGDESRDFIYIDDLINFLMSLKNTHFFSGIYNIGSGTSTTVNEILSFLTKLSLHAPTINYVSKNNTDVDHIVLNSQKIREVFGWKPNKNIEEGIFECWRIANNNSVN